MAFSLRISTLQQSDHDARGQLYARACSVPVAFTILTILALHRLPHEGVARITLAGALGLLVLGGDAPGILPARGLPELGTVAAGLGVIAGLMMGGYGLRWLILAALFTAVYWRVGISFNLGWWGYTFPLGVYTVATFKLGTALHLPFFARFSPPRLLGMWLLVGSKTCSGR